MISCIHLSCSTHHHVNFNEKVVYLRDSANNLEPFQSSSRSLIHIVHSLESLQTNEGIRKKACPAFPSTQTTLRNRPMDKCRLGGTLTTSCRSGSRLRHPRPRNTCKVCDLVPKDTGMSTCKSRSAPERKSGHQQK